MIWIAGKADLSEFTVEPNSENMLHFAKLIESLNETGED